MNRKLLISSLLLWVSIPLAAQKIVAETTTVNVGKTGYQQPITAVFKFRNQSSRKLKIRNVRPDCNCTDIDYPKKDIEPNGKFEIRMTYDARQLGHFDKQAAIISNGSDKPLYICMQGIVLAHYVDLSASYPVEMGDLRIDRSEVEFDDINRGDQQVQELRIYNNGTRAYHPNLMHLPSYLSATVKPETLLPDETGTMTITLNSRQLHDYGLTQTSIYLAGNPGDKVSPDHEITVSAVMLPSFEGMTDAQRASAPILRLSEETVDIHFDGKKKRTVVIEVSNRGQSELKISSLQMFTRGLMVSLGKRLLAPGETTKLKITALRNELKTVRSRPRILMISNDPAKPKVTITINAK